MITNGLKFSVKGKKETTYDASQAVIALKTAFNETETRFYKELGIIMAILTTMVIICIGCCFGIRKKRFCKFFEYTRNKFRNKKTKKKEIRMENNESEIIVNQTDLMEMNIVTDLKTTNKPYSRGVNQEILESSLDNSIVT
jgi:D-alanyl-lipoteichoic acid acyltransferase DltB (MBOAT superfamily)